MSGKVSKPRPSVKKPPVSKSAKKRVEIQAKTNDVSPVDYRSPLGE